MKRKGRGALVGALEESTKRADDNISIHLRRAPDEDVCRLCLAFKVIIPYEVCHNHSTNRHCLESQTITNSILVHFFW